MKINFRYSIVAIFILYFVALPVRQVSASGYGWWYFSFDWNSLNTVFGSSENRMREKLLAHVDDMLKHGEEFTGITDSKLSRHIAYKMINQGISYAGLSTAEALLQDNIFFSLLTGDYKFNYLKTNIYAELEHPFASVETIRELHNITPSQNNIMRFFLNGRSYIEPHARKYCYSEYEVTKRRSNSWGCEGAYVLMTPDEVKSLLNAIEKRNKNLSSYAEKDIEYLIRDLRQIVNLGHGMLFFGHD